MGEEKLVGGTILSSMVGCKGVPCSIADPSPVIMAEPFSESNWNPFASLDQHWDLDMPTAPSSYNPGMQEDKGFNSSNGYPAEQMPGLEFFGSGKIMGHLVLPEHDVQTTGSLLPTESVLSEEQSNGIDPKGIKRRKISQSGAFDSLSSFNRIQTAEAEDEKDNMKKEKGEQIPRILPDPVAHKLRSEQAKGNSFSGVDLKEDYAHARAKRCQATKSHSLAERVRREKISQRMKFLQDLVPGCSKITRKASMLDEIINYIQSLQQQVQLLSMKLATVHPEMQFDIEHVLSSEILHSQIGNSGVPMIGSGFSASHFHFQSPIQQEDMQAQMSNLQNVKKLDFISNAHMHTKSPGPVKME